MKDMQDIELESEDLHAALEELHQYVDVTEEDLKKIYAIALRHARERLTFKVPVKDVMTADVICIKKDADIHEAARILSENRISGLPVVDEEKHLIGIVTEADILYSAGMKKSHNFRDILRHVLGEPHPKIRNGSKVEEIMTTKVITTTPDRDIKEVARILDENMIKRLPVVDENNKLIGIISRANIVRYLGKQ
jgi:CBS-domain-containing membrane protein